MSLGSAIAQARENAGMSVDDLSSCTSIRTALLRELELDNFQKCGGEAYARGHLRNIATAVGIDPSEFLKIYEVEQITAKRTMYDLLVESSVTAAPNQKSRISIKALSMVSAIAVVFAVGGQIVYTNLQPSKSVTTLSSASLAPEATASVTPNSSSGATSTLAATETVPPGATAQVLAPAPNGVVISVTATRGATWLSVTSKAGVAIYSGRLALGETNTFSDSAGVNIRFGNAGAVDVLVNGVQMAAPGALGEVVDASYGSNSTN